jgi:hypothetical protein
LPRRGRHPVAAALHRRWPDAAPVKFPRCCNRSDSPDNFPRPAVAHIDTPRRLPLLVALHRRLADFPQ